jgi:predicted LPLAT superfamily acyltransferase
MSAKPDMAPAATPRASAAWAQIPERGSPALVSVGVFFALRLGRRLSRLSLYVVAACFLAFVPDVRRNSKNYLRRALGRRASYVDVFRHIYAFGATLLDRFYLVHGRYDLFALTTQGEPGMHEIVSRRRGVFLLGAHLGSFEMLSAIGRRNAGLPVAMAMYDEQAGHLTSVFKASQAQSPPEIIPLGHLDSMLRINDCLDEGKIVGMLADRTIGEAPAQIVNFLGQPALFPSGPMRLAAALRRPVVFMTALYRGANRYHVVFVPIADFSEGSAAGREAAVREGVVRYAALLEQYCRSDPYNWFNFFDFWQAPPAGADTEPG